MGFIKFRLFDAINICNKELGYSFTQHIHNSQIVMFEHLTDLRSEEYPHSVSFLDFWLYLQQVFLYFWTFLYSIE